MLPLVLSARRSGGIQMRERGSLSGHQHGPTPLDPLRGKGGKAWRGHG